MAFPKSALISCSVLIAALTASSAGWAAVTVSDMDKAFVAKVSEGGMYEVELGKVAQKQGTTQDIKDQANTEVHDHMLVGAKLKSIARANNLEFPASLNNEFQARLAKITALPADQFDAAYVEDMQNIHNADGAAFAKEAEEGTNPDLKAFAAETHRIVERHLGELGAKVD